MVRIKFKIDIYLHNYSKYCDFQMWTSVKPTMEGVINYALTQLALLNVPVVQGTSWHLIIATAMVSTDKLHVL